MRTSSAIGATALFISSVLVCAVPLSTPTPTPPAQEFMLLEPSASPAASSPTPAPTFSYISSASSSSASAVPTVLAFRLSNTTTLSNSPTLSNDTAMSSNAASPTGSDSDLAAAAAPSASPIDTPPKFFVSYTDAWNTTDNSMHVSLPNVSAQESGSLSHITEQAVINTLRPYHPGNSTLTYRLFFPDGFDFSDDARLPSIYSGHIGCSSCFSTRVRYDSEGKGELYMYNPTQEQPESLCSIPPLSVCEPRGMHIGRGAWTFPSNRWINVRQDIWMNTPGQSDGGFNVWIDGNIVLSSSTVRYTDSRRVCPIMGGPSFGARNEMFDACLPEPRSRWTYAPATTRRIDRVVTKVVTVTQATTVAVQVSVTQPVTVTQPLIVTQPVMITQPVFVTQPVLVTQPVTVTQAVTVTQPATVTQAITETTINQVTQTATETATVTVTAAPAEPTPIEPPVEDVPVESPPEEEPAPEEPAPEDEGDADAEGVRSLGVSPSGKGVGPRDTSEIDRRDDGMWHGIGGYPGDPGYKGAAPAPAKGFPYTFTFQQVVTLPGPMATVTKTVTKPGKPTPKPKAPKKKP